MSTCYNSVHTHFETIHSMFTHYDTVHKHFDIVHTNFDTGHSMFTQYDTIHTHFFTNTLAHFTHCLQAMTQFTHTLT